MVQAVVTMLLKNERRIIASTRKFGKNIPIVVKDDTLSYIAGKLRGSAKLRVRRWSKDLKDSIFTEIEGTTIYFGAEAPWAYFQEEGFAPHWVHKSMKTGSGRKTIGKWMRDKGITGNFLWVGGRSTSYRPFMEPAMRAVEPKIPKLIDKAIVKAATKAYRRKG